MDIQAQKGTLVGVDNVFSRVVILANKTLFIKLLADLLKEKSNLACEVVAADQIDNLCAGDLVMLNLADINLSEAEHVIEAMYKANTRASLVLISSPLHSNISTLIAWPVVSGVFNLDDSDFNLDKALQHLSLGKCWFSREEADHIASCRQQPRKLASLLINTLTRREQQLLTQICRGQSNQEIADKLCVSAHTVKGHLTNLYKKLEVNSRSKAVTWAFAHNVAWGAEA